MDAWDVFDKILGDQGIHLPSYNNEAERFRQMATVKAEQDAGRTTNAECLEKMKRIMHVLIRP